MYLLMMSSLMTRPLRRRRRGMRKQTGCLTEDKEDVTVSGKYNVLPPLLLQYPSPHHAIALKDLRGPGSQKNFKNPRSLQEITAII